MLDCVIRHVVHILPQYTISELKFLASFLSLNFTSRSTFLLLKYCLSILEDPFQFHLKFELLGLCTWCCMRTRTKMSDQTGA